MAEWFQVMFPEATGEDDLVPLYRYRTPLGNWEVHTVVRTFRYQPFKQPNDFFCFGLTGITQRGTFTPSSMQLRQCIRTRRVLKPGTRHPLRQATTWQSGNAER